ncbi:hypothetical protein N9917_00060 [Deltaproteobacteria bacterium]|nr:hypothetical protein [Deltaproteobacteria bacterium]
MSALTHLLIYAGFISVMGGAFHVGMCWALDVSPWPWKRPLLDVEEP